MDIPSKEFANYVINVKAHHNVVSAGWNITRRYNGYTLPSARYISLQFVSTRRVSEDETFTHMVMQWGQFMDHDIDFAPMAASNARYH